MKHFWSDSFPGNLFTQTWLNATTIESTSIWSLTNRNDEFWIILNHSSVEVAKVEVESM
ncbi:MAG: hypothetical protein ACTS80_00765 [Candidatus Hodgkinia cicadicola]